VQSRLVETVRPDNPLVGWRLPDLDFSSSASLGGYMGEVMRQASMVAYVDSFRVLFFLAVGIAPLSLMLKMVRGQPTTAEAPPIHAE
jgi:DHA2 family multidrug resistance protein